MIPSTFKKRVPKNTYFALAEEYVFLESIFEDYFYLIDMIVYPIYVLIQLICLEPSPMFIFGLVKTYQMWVDWFRFQTLKSEIQIWKMIVKKLKGPWISTNNPKYHVFVYADAMQRISE